MKKIFTLIAVAAMAMGVNAENKVVTWAVAEGQTGGSVIAVKDGSVTVGNLAFGTTDNWQVSSRTAKVTYKDVEYSFSNSFETTSTNGNGGADLAADGSSAYNYCAFVPAYSGTFIIVLHNGGTGNEAKPFWTYEDGVSKAGTIIGNGTLNIEYDGKTDIKTLNGGTAVTGGIKYSVTAGKTYTFSINGSKPRWMGLIFEYNSTTNNINTVKAVEAEDSAAYNLAGQKVADGFKGIVVKNGRKMIQK